MREHFPTLTEHGCARLLNAPRRRRSDRADRPLIAIDPLIESRHKGYAFALNTPELASRHSSHVQYPPRPRERKNHRVSHRENFGMSAQRFDKEWRGQH